MMHLHTANNCLVNIRWMCNRTINRHKCQYDIALDHDANIAKNGSAFAAVRFSFDRRGQASLPWGKL